MPEQSDRALLITQAIENQTCPFCGEGPWRVVALHTYRAHDVKASELRTIAEAPAAFSTASPENRERRREIAASNPRFVPDPAGSEGRRRAAPKISRAVAERMKSPTERLLARERLNSPESEAARRSSWDARLRGHGTRASYRRGCRCRPCVDAKNAATAAWKRKKRAENRKECSALGCHNERDAGPGVRYCIDHRKYRKAEVAV